MNAVEKESLKWLEEACTCLKENKKMIILKLKTGRNITFLFDVDDTEQMQNTIISRWLELNSLAATDVEEKTIYDPRAI